MLTSSSKPLSFALHGSPLRCYHSAPKPVKLFHTIYPSEKHSSLNLIVAHGVLGSSTNFRSIVKHPKISEIANSVLIDLRNHGNSEHSPDMSLDAMSADIAHLVTELKLSNVVLLGHSLGGRVSMNAALRYPELFKAIIVADIMPINYLKVHDQEPTGHTYNLIKNLNKMDLKKDLKSLKNEIKKFEPSNDVVNFVATNLVQVSKDEHKWRCNLQAIVENYKTIVQDQITSKDGRKFQRRVKVVMGGNSDYYVHQEVGSFSNVFGQFDEKKDLEVLKGAGHWVHFDKPHDFIEIVSKFMNELKSI